jgi:hypothetical protein
LSGRAKGKEKSDDEASVCRRADENKNRKRSMNVPDLLHALEVITQLGVEVVRDDLVELAILAVLLVVQEPLRDVELERRGDDRLEVLDLILRQLTGTAHSNVFNEEKM